MNERLAHEPYYIAGSLKAESPMVVAMSSCMRDPKNVEGAGDMNGQASTLTRADLRGEGPLRTSLRTKRIVEGGTQP
jgi:hypothetical protein